MYTLLVEAKTEFSYLLQQAISCLLNTIIMIQFASYYKNGVKGRYENVSYGTEDDEKTSGEEESSPQL